VESITGAPRAGLVNRFIEDLAAKNGDAALAVIAETEKAGISMNIFATLVLEKMRFILLVEHSKASEAAIRERVSPDDWEFISAEAGKRSMAPETLIAMLEAVEAVPRARIEQLPLELAVVKICG
jgi:hypothetical protein